MFTRKRSVAIVYMGPGPTSGLKTLDVILYPTLLLYYTLTKGRDFVLETELRRSQEQVV